jgi:hypothetical protein
MKRNRDRVRAVRTALQLRASFVLADHLDAAVAVDGPLVREQLVAQLIIRW